MIKIPTATVKMLFYSRRAINSIQTFLGNFQICYCFSLTREPTEGNKVTHFLLITSKLVQPFSVETSITFNTTEDLK